MSNDDFFILRDRAYELAGSGRFKRWDQIARALQGEGFRYVLIVRLRYDKLAVMMLDRCCDQARVNSSQRTPLTQASVNMRYLADAPANVPHFYAAGLGQQSFADFPCARVICAINPLHGDDHIQAVHGKKAVSGHGCKGVLLFHLGDLHFPQAN